MNRRACTIASGRMFGENVQEAAEKLSSEMDREGHDFNRAVKPEKASAL